MPNLIPPQPGDKPFTVSEALAAGITRRELQGPRFRRILHRVYVTASVPDTIELQADAAAKLLPKSAVYRGITAAQLLDIPVPAAPGIAAMVAPGERRPRVNGLTTSECRYPTSAVMIVHGRRLMCPELLFIDLADTLDTEDLIVVGDALLNRGWTSTELIQAAAAHPWPGVIAARKALPDLEPRAASPGETRSRLALVELGFPRPRAGVVILDEHHEWVAEVDLLIDDPPVVFQYDGEVHFKTWRRRRSDAVRDEVVRDLGREVVVLTNRDLNDLYRLERRANAAFERAAGRIPRGYTRDGKLPTLRPAAS